MGTAADDLMDMEEISPLFNRGQDEGSESGLNDLLVCKDYELVQVHKAGKYAEVVIRDKNGCEVYAGNLPKQSNPSEYY